MDGETCKESSEEERCNRKGMKERGKEGKEGGRKFREEISEGWTER